MVSEYDKKEYDFSLEFTLHEVFIWAQLLAMSENDAELLTNLSPWTPVEHAKQYLILILLLETVKSFGIDLLTDVEMK